MPGLFAFTEDRMSPDAAVAEPEVTTAEPVTEAPPNPVEGEQPQPEGGAAPEPEGGQQEESQLDLSAAEELIAAEVERRVAERAEKAEADAAKRGLQRTKEADDGEAARLALYATAKSQGEQARNILVNVTKGITEGTYEGTWTPSDADQAARFIAAGKAAEIAQDNEVTVKALIDAALPDQTDAEKEALEPLLYEFRRNGRFDKLPATVTDLALARKDAEIAGLKKQLADRTAIRAAAEKLAAAANGAGPGVGAETPKGKPAGSQDKEKILQRTAYGVDSDGNRVTEADREWARKNFPG